MVASFINILACCRQQSFWQTCTNICTYAGYILLLATLLYFTPCLFRGSVRVFGLNFVCICLMMI